MMPNHRIKDNLLHQIIRARDKICAKCCFLFHNRRLGLPTSEESRISRVVKKLVNKDEPKAQEEMAWRVAEMIVKDVTNLTMGGQADDEEDT